MAAADEKRRLRSWARSLPALPAVESARLDRLVCERLLHLVEEWAPVRACLYAALPGEVSTAAIESALIERGCELAFPRVDDGALRVHRVSGSADLVRGYRGIAEPEPGAPELAPETVDLILAPGLLFDRTGVRLGRGGGHYDRLFAACGARATRIGLCYAERVRERLPHEPWDERVDWVVTDGEGIRVPDRREEPR